ncbi:hypothetical protein N7471_010707 [Penicillium samsonianum]|uniref:uncharacterized protein n=1 Tax=Penicillium samsonianum TaxID=1882272 RepID=UPI002547FA9B|nr:uncharacterized protein N7471_010707 [Penicillium samsonianum]KAJ6126214.1 hypothetical protein N7471_010707 [Penicillium samsonianum]
MWLASSPKLPSLAQRVDSHNGRMEHLRYSPEYQVLACIPCRHAILPAYLDPYLKGHREEWLGLESAKAISVLKKRLQEFTLADHSQLKIQIPSPSSLALPGLKVEERLDCTQCRFVTRSKGWMQKMSGRISLPHDVEVDPRRLPSML